MPAMMRDTVHRSEQAKPSGVLVQSSPSGESDIVKASELQDLLVRTLVRSFGGSPRHWRAVIGPVRLYDIRTHAHCNWSVAPSGGSREIGRVENLLDTVRLEHPIVTDG
jgi:hypothetical protein